MEQGQGWVKFFRSIVNWEWYDDANTFRMFFHLIVTANHESVSWKGRLIKRGQKLTTIRKLADELSIDEKTVQRCLRNLESTKEIKVEPSKSGTMITIRKYNDYQCNGKEDVGIIPTPAPTPAPTQPPTPAPTKQEYKECKNERIINTPTPARAREAKIGEETFGTFANVFLKPAEHRAIVEEFGQEAVDATIEDLSCKLADGTTDSSNHYATLRYWLNYQRDHGRKPVKDDDRTPQFVPINWDK